MSSRHLISRYLQAYFFQTITAFPDHGKKTFQLIKDQKQVIASHSRSAHAGTIDKGLQMLHNKTQLQQGDLIQIIKK